MSDSSNDGYLLIFRGTNWYKGLSPEQMQRVFDQWMAWFNGLKADGRAGAGNPLEREGRIVSGNSGRIVSDDPFAEAKETIGGYFLLAIDSMDEAVDIARQLPGTAPRHPCTASVWKCGRWRSPARSITNFRRKTGSPTPDPRRPIP